MITVYGLEPRSVVIAYLLTKLKGTKAVLEDPKKKYFFDSVEDTRKADFDPIYTEYREKFGGIDFLEDLKLYDIMSSDIFWALRFDSPDRGALALQVIGQIASEGSKDYLSEKTSEAREMRSRVKRVLAEFNRAMRFVKFTRFDEVKLSLGTATFENDICDMVLRGEATRCPEGFTVAIGEGSSVRILLNGIVFVSKRPRIPLTPDRKEFKVFWGGLPDSAGTSLSKDENHTSRELPPISIPRAATATEKPTASSSTLDDFSK